MDRAGLFRRASEAVTACNRDTERLIKELVLAEWPNATHVTFEREPWNDEPGSWWTIREITVDGQPVGLGHADNQDRYYGEDECVGSRLNDLASDIIDSFDSPWVDGASWMDIPINALGERDK